MFLAVWLVAMCSGALVGSCSDVMAQRADRAERRTPRPDWAQRDTTDVFFADVLHEALAGQWPRTDKVDEAQAATSPNLQTTNPPVGSFVWFKAVDGDLLVDEIKRVALVLKKATRSQATWDQYGSHQLQTDLVTTALLFRIISEWQGNIRFQSDALTVSRLLTQAAGHGSHAPKSALASARTVSGYLQDLVNGNRIAADNSQQPSDGYAQLDRSRLMARLELAIETNVESGLQSTSSMSSKQPELCREANLATAIFGALCRDGCTDADQPAYVAYCKSSARYTVILRRAVSEHRYDDACQALMQLRQSCNNCHAEFRF